PRARYDARSYAHAITAACDRAWPHPGLAGVEPGRLTAGQRAELAAWRKAHRWHPHQLRHTAATRFRGAFGLDIARVLLGHRTPAVTDHYAEIDRARAVHAAAQAG